MSSLELKPFHKSILALINEPSSICHIEFVIALLKSTKIAGAHDEIAAAVEKRFGALAYWAREIAEVKELILFQKQNAATDGEEESEADAIVANRFDVAKIVKTLHDQYAKYENRVFEKPFVVSVRANVKKLVDLMKKKQQ